MNISGASYAASKVYHEDLSPAWVKTERYTFCEFFSKFISKFVR